MTDHEITRIADDIDWMRNAVTDRPLLAFARAIIAQARAEWEAELKPVAYVMQNDLDELAKTGRRAVVIYNEPVSPLDVPLAIIPSTKE